MRGVGREYEDVVLHVAHVVGHPRLVGLVQQLADEIDRWFGSRTALLSQTLVDERPQMGLILEFLAVDHGLLAFQWKSRGNMRHVERVAPHELAPERCVSAIDLDFDVGVVQVLQPGCVAIVDVVQMDALARLAHLGVGRRKFGCGLEVPLQGLLAVLATKVEVDDDVVLRDHDPMEPGGVQLLERGPHRIPLLHRVPGLGWRRVLRRIIGGQNIERRVRAVHGEPLRNA